MSYTALICKPKYSKLEGSDNLFVASVCGYQVLTNKSTNQDELKIFFPSGGQINHDFLSLNNEYRQKYGLNQDKEKGGFFESDRRIKSIRMRGTHSEGILFPISSLELLNIDYNQFKEGDNLDIITDRLSQEIILCEKFVPEFSQRVKGVFNHKIFLSPHQVPNFEQHFDTLQLRQYTRHIPDGADIWIDEKWHGTSGRTSNTLFIEDIPLWKQRINNILTWLKVPCSFKPKETHRIISGTRRTILNIKTAEWYRQEAHDMLAKHIPENWTIYYEIVGYQVKEPEQLSYKPFFTHKINKTHKDLRKKYGEQANYTYGCTPEFPFRIYIYRIKACLPNTDHYFEFDPESIQSWVETLSNSLILAIQPILLFTNFKNTEDNIVKLTNKIETQIQEYHKQWPDHPSEGACIKIIHPQIPPEKSIMKWKSFEFALLEDIAYSNPNYIDIEETC